MRGRVIVTPTPGLDALHALAAEHGYHMFPFPEDVGGRYSVFTPVGLLPMAVAGVDIDALLRGAADAQADVERGGPHRRMALDYALSRNLLYQKGYDVEVMAFFEPSFLALGKWWRQLFGESEGKELRGVFPTVAQYTEDLHSLGQFMQAGKRHVTESFLHMRPEAPDVRIGTGAGDRDEWDYLAGQTLDGLNEAAYQATVQAHGEGGVPCHVFEIERADEYHLGEWMYTMMISCFYSAVLLGVDPFDQPGVEAYKTEMFRRLKHKPAATVLTGGQSMDRIRVWYHRYGLHRGHRGHARDRIPEQERRMRTGRALRRGAGARRAVGAGKEAGKRNDLPKRGRTAGHGGRGEPVRAQQRAYPAADEGLRRRQARVVRKADQRGRGDRRGGAAGGAAGQGAHDRLQLPGHPRPSLHEAAA